MFKRIFILSAVIWMGVAVPSKVFAQGAPMKLVKCDTGLEAFQKTLYPVLAANCAKCHGDGGEASEHSVSDVEEAYKTSRKLADFSNIQNSKFIRKVNEKHWLDHESGDLNVTSDLIAQKLNDWWLMGESACPAPFVLTSKPTKVPAMAVGENYQTLSFSFLPTPQYDLSGCTVKLDIQRFTDSLGGANPVPGSFRVKRLRASCATRAVKVTGIRVLVNQATSAYENLYDDVSMLIPDGELEVQLASRLMIITERPGVNQLSIAINAIEMK